MAGRGYFFKTHTLSWHDPEQQSALEWHVVPVDRHSVG
jgi:hypothetical protein